MTEQTFDAAFERVRKLVADFGKHEKAYLAPAYQERDVRSDFIDKFWIALGWDVNHEHQTDPYAQDVKAEKNVDVKGRIKKADYAFLAANFRDVRFFVEAKKPSRNIDNADDYFQTIRYGWNAQTPLSILTDFEQFRLLDCRYKPDVATALNRVVKKFHYTDYAEREKFAEIYHLFSRAAINEGALEKFAATLPKPTGKAKQRGLFGGSYKSVDEDFLAELDELRDELARSFKNRNSHLDGEDLTEATQRTIDRLVFMRFLEDKLIEPEVIVERLGERGSVWGDFVSESQRLDRIYNGIIFKRHAIIDDASFVVDERMFAGVRERLSHTNSPYDFNSLPVHILGSIYERFLGKVIETTDKRASVVEKPEVRKAGGVYYTPEYIVRYIVKETIGKLIAGKTPAEIAQMRFADIACGSGSFLLGVYDELLRYHTSYYNRNKRTRSEALKAGCIEREAGGFALSLIQKREILLNNIYGVDIDAQAVEVAQLSLFLKLLEDETPATARQQMTLKHALLPNLNDNIKCGNSLVGYDILDGHLFEPTEERKLNPMDFKDAFKEVMQGGGFDAVVGNPPWVSLSGKFGSELYSKTQIDYLINRYQGNTYMPNMYEYFVAQGLNLVHENGFFSLIVPDRLGFNSQFVNLRKKMLSVSRLVSLLYKAPFPGITADTLVFVLQKGIASEDTSVRVSEYEKQVMTRPQKDFLKSSNFAFEYFIDNDIENIANKINSLSNVVELKDICNSTSGFGGKSQMIHEVKQDDREIQTIKGDSIKRYETKKIYWFDFRRENITGRTTDTRKLGASPKVLLRKTGDSIIATYDESGIFPEQSLYFLFDNKTDLNFKYVLGVLNSNLLTFFFKAKSLTNKESIAQVKKVDLDILPIRTINFTDQADRARHDRMCALVEAMLAAKKHLQLARSD